MKRKRKPKPRPPKKTGRPSLFDIDEHPKIARQLTGEGKTLVDIARVLGINPDTIQEWKKRHIAFSVAIDQGKEDCLDNIERALAERAQGFKHGSEEIKVIRGKVKRIKTTTQYPPDVHAAKFVLTNKRSKEWAERQSVEHAVSTDLRKLIMESLAVPSVPGPVPTEEAAPPVGP